MTQSLPLAEPGGSPGSGIPGLGGQAGASGGDPAPRRAVAGPARPPDGDRLGRLAGPAYGPRAGSPDTITFMTVPHTADPGNAADVVRTADAAAAGDDPANDRRARTPAGGASTTPSSPSPTVKVAGDEAFTGADTTSVC